jgi:predicted HD phosphohydrolase
VCDPRKKNGASPALITASLLHDIGSIRCSDYPELTGAPKRGHEEIGAEVLGRWFGPEVTEPVALHVLAKRYLVANEPGYLEKLSPGSTASLKNQGQPLSPQESEEFLGCDFATDSLALRHWDDDAKVPGARTLELKHFKQHLMSSLSDGVQALN